MLGKAFGAALIITGLPTNAQAQSADRMLVTLAAGEEASHYGVSYRAAVATRAVLVQSSELITAAVIEGTLVQGDVAAQAGQALVTPIDAGRTRRYGFDAARLAASLPPHWTQTEAPLAALAQVQRRREFWGLIEPVGINAAAPVAPEAEAFRRAYLGNDTILSLRRAAGGNRATLASLTVQRFAEAVAAGDAATIADLIDPMPFSEANGDPAIWLPARAAFAARLASDGALARALAVPVAASTDNPQSFDLGGAFRVGLVMRDRAMFVAEVEPIQ